MTAPLPIQSLYRKVRESEDPSALEELEERLTLWFETLCIAYYGDNEVSTKDQVFNTVTTEFSENFKGKTADLIPFAYDIVKTHIHKNDLPPSNELPEDKISIALLKSAFDELTTEEQEILEKFYSPTYQGQRPQSTEECFEALKAREALKAMLAKDKSTDFQIIHDAKDIIPILFYEGLSFASTSELERFEKWLINTPNCCIDICDFDRFAKILRGNEIFKVEETQQKIQIPSDIDVDKPDLGTDIELDKTQSPIINTPPQQESDLGKFILLGVLAAFLLIAIYIISTSIFGGT